jgi:lysophospholipase L1-like esterase
MHPYIRPVFAAFSFLAVSTGLLQAQPAAPMHAPASVPPEMPRDPTLPTLWVAGDSTAVRWTVPFPGYFDPARINVVSRARGGRSSRTFVTEGLWGQMMDAVKPGDIVLIQFGHNDPGALNDEPPPPLRARGTLPGLGEETKEIDNVMTKKHEVVHTFGWYMRRMIADVKAKGATPIILTLTVRDIWKDGKVEHGPGHYSEWSEEVAKAAGIPVVDVTTIVAARFDKMGQASVHALYPVDHTHFGPEGSLIHAAAVVYGLKELKDSPVAGDLSAKGKAVGPE